MNAQEAHRLLAANLVQTYLELAHGIPGTEITRGKNWAAATNSFAHPICNFAICEQIDVSEARDLARLASGRAQFNVYVCRTSKHDPRGEILEGEGFSCVYQMVEMAFDGPPHGVPGKLVKVTGPAARKRLTDFMTWQFFSTQSPAVREKISLATASARALVPYELEADSRNRPAGAVMLCPSRGMLGLYNLCVSMPMRSRGYGSSVVFAVQAIARQESVIVGLQCDVRLTDWYEQLGFKKVGMVDVYGLTFGVKL